jgi:hypothetical protein
VCGLYRSYRILRIIKSRKIRWKGHAARIGRRNPYRNIVGRPIRKSPLGIPKMRWEDGVKMDLVESQFRIILSRNLFNCLAKIYVIFLVYFGSVQGRIYRMAYDYFSDVWLLGIFSKDAA